MYISKEQLASRLAGATRLELRQRQGLGSSNRLSRETKVLAGVLAKVDTQENVAAALGTSQETVSNIINGKGKQNAELQSDITAASKEVREKVSGKAIDILMSSLNVVDSKLSKENALAASAIAKNMVHIVDRMTPNRAAEGNFSPRILINIHGSKQRDEADYDAIEVEAVNQ